MVRPVFYFMLLPFAIGVTSPVAHPMHTTFTEITQPTLPGVVSITIRGFEEDLAAAARVSFPRGPVDSAITSYLTRRTTLTDRRGQRIAIHPTSVRRRADVIWLSFQTRHAVEISGGRFLNAALTERFDDQVNLVQIKVRQRTRTILFTPGDGAKPIAE